MLWEVSVLGDLLEVLFFLVSEMSKYKLRGDARLVCEQCVHIALSVAHLIHRKAVRGIITRRAAPTPAAAAAAAADVDLSVLLRTVRVLSGELMLFWVPTTQE